MPEARICILTQSHLCRNPRVLKEAIALDNQGYSVYVLNAIFSKTLLQEDQDLLRNHPRIRVEHVSELSEKSISAWIDRAFNRIGRTLVKRYGFENPIALGYGPFNYWSKCRRINASLYICHQELATYIGTRLLKAGYKVAFDFEDWYSADLLPEARSKRPIRLLQKIEALALKQGTYCTTTSKAMSTQLAAAYDCPTPEVIYNTFPSQPSLLNREHSFSDPLKLFWFSQTIGPGRGLENFITLLKSINAGVELHLLGNIDAAYSNLLTGLLGEDHRLYFHELVEEKHLAGKIAEFDIGLALEQTDPPNRNYTITNKIFQYLQSGLPVIATKTAGQCEMFEKFKPGKLLSQQANADDVETLNLWLKDAAALHQARSIAKEAAAYYSWEHESQKLLDLVNNAIGP